MFSVAFYRLSRGKVTTSYFQKIISLSASGSYLWWVHQSQEEKVYVNRILCFRYMKSLGYQTVPTPVEAVLSMHGMETLPNHRLEDVV